ncbi:pentapeptide repeat-containing protein [Streptomyces anulatus]|uniref:pentapeptide repeat-containing protein n=1 Tax=Streptomyces anulatus TaxID=1892 RepID=UPI0036DB2C39
MLPLAFTGAVLVAGFVFFTGWDLLGARELKQQHQIDSKTLFDLVKLSFGVVAGAGALVALVVAYRRQRVDEDAALRDTTRLHNERFTTAVSQLGDTSPTVRLGGVHALVGLADDAPTRELRQTCIDVLCAFLRLPYTAESDLPPDDSAAQHHYLALREARHTVIRLIGDHLRLPAEHPHSWQGHNFDFTGVAFDGGDLSEANFTGGTVRFSGATFSGGVFRFNGATFHSTVVFDHVSFSAGTVDFGSTTFIDGNIGFEKATFSGGTVDFLYARFSGGVVSFAGAEISDGTLNFNGAGFSRGDVHFNGVAFTGGDILFRQARFIGSLVDFDSAQFAGSEVDFSHAEFIYGNVDFSDADFIRGDVDFRSASLADGVITIDDASAGSGVIAGLE